MSHRRAVELDGDPLDAGEDCGVETGEDRELAALDIDLQQTDDRGVDALDDGLQVFPDRDRL